MTQTELIKAQRKANGYKTPSIFMDGVDYALKNITPITISEKTLKEQIRELTEQLEYAEKQNEKLLNRVQSAALKIAQYEKFLQQTGSNYSLIVLKEKYNMTIEQIELLVCSVMPVTHDKLRLKTRQREIVRARQAIWYLSRFFTRMSLNDLGKYYGAFDHTTVLHGINTISTLMESDEDFKDLIQGMKRVLLTNQIQ